MKTSETKMKSRINKVSKAFVIGFLIIVSTLSYSLKAQTNSYPFDTPNCCGVWTSTCSDPYDFYLYQCTSYVAWKLNQANDETPQISPVFNNNITGDGGGENLSCTFQSGERLSHACRWADALQDSGYFVDNTPVPGSIAHWDANPAVPIEAYGHVAYVESINTDGTINISEYNYATSCSYGTRTITATDADNYIRFNRFAITNTPTIVAPSPLSQGQGCTITVEVQNEFSSDVTANFRCALYSNSNVFLGEIDIKNGEFFSANEIRTFVFSKPIINSSPGNYKIWIESRVTDDTPWTVLHKENASSIIPVSISSSGSGQNAPDIAITNINILPNYNPDIGDDVYFQATIENVGQVMANNINLNFIVEGQAFYTSYTTSLAPGAINTITSPAYIFNSSGTYQCFAEAEAVTGEMYLLNNTAVQSVVVYGESFLWSTEISNTNSTLNGVYYLNPTNAIAVGDAGKIATYNGVDWTTISNPNGAWELNDVYAADANNIYAVGQGGHVFFYNGSQWSTVTINGAYQDFEAVDGNNANDIWIVGTEGIIYHYNGSSWSLINSGTSAWLKGVFCAGNLTYVAGFLGTILQIDGTNVYQMTDVPSESYYDIHGTSDNNIFAVGKDATIIRYNGSTWAVMNSPLPSTDDITGIWAADNGEAFACTQSTNILHFNGSLWNLQTDNIPNNLQDIFGLTETDIISVGTQGNIRHYESTASPLIINLPVPFKSQVPPGNWTVDQNCGTTNNCGQTCMVMYNSFYQYSQPTIQNIKDVDDFLFTEYGQPINCYNGSITYISDLVNIATLLYGYQNVETHTNWTLEDIKNSLLTNKPVVVAVKTNMSTNGGNHFMILRGYDEENGVLYFNDPGRSLASGYGKNVEYSVAQFEQSWATQGNACMIINEASGSGPGGSTGAPMSLTSEIATDTIIIGWEPAYGTSPIKYKIYRDGLLIDSTLASQTLYIDTNMIFNVQYRYNITAVDTTESPFSQDLFVTIPGQYYTPVWEGDNPYSPQNIIITNALFDGEMLTSGCEIAVFDGDICVGSSIINDTITANNPLFIVAGADDATTNEIEGFIESNTIIFRYYLPLSQSEIQSVTATYNPTLDTIYTKLGTSVVELNGTSEFEQCIELSNSWNIISFYVTTEYLSMDSILKPLKEEGHLVKVIDEAGGFMQEIPGIGWLNTIGNMSNSEAYYIKLSTDDTLCVIGNIVTLPYSIPLQTNWNLMGYPAPNSQDAISVLQPLIDSSHLTKVISQSGGFIQNIPGLGWLNTIYTFVPGQGYYVKLSADDTLDINVNPINSPFQNNNIIKEGKVYQRISVGYPYLPMHIIARFDNDIEIVKGDELGIFVNDVCIGSGIITDPYAPVIAFATTDDPTTETIDGGQPEDSLKFKLLHLGREYDLKCKESIFYEPLETKVINFFTTGLDILENNDSEFIVSEVIPNPFSNAAKIYVKTPGTGNLTIELLDFSGAVIKTLLESKVESKNIEIEIKGKDLKQGIYFIHVRYQNDGVVKDELRKVVIHQK